jgi:orotate phosphoribosyltransferase
MNLFQLGDFTLASGAKSRWKLECDALTYDDWAALAEMVRQMVGAFSEVRGVPRGGLKLADALRPFAGAFGPRLVVDDVLTTGGSMTRFAAEWAKEHQSVYTGAVVFARGQRPHWVRAVFEMPECFWPRPPVRGAT